MALEKEIWQTHIEQGLFKGNEFLLRSKDESEYVMQGKVVHIPQAGVGSGVVKNRTVLPATVNKRNDAEVTYVIDEYTSNPVLIPNIDTVQLSYNKRDSVLEEDMNTLREKTADDLLRIWAGTGSQIIRTTGAATSGKAAGATGNRKMFTKDDLRAARLKLTNQNVPKEGRVALLPADMMDTLLADSDLLKRDYASELDVKNGIIVRLFGFDLIERPTVNVYDAAGTPAPKDPGTASAVTDNAAALCWHPSFVARALGTIDMFEMLKSPLYFGDIYSFLVMMGGRQRRADLKGVVSVVEAAAA